ncbi:MAG: hypothetical protein ACO1OK_03640 [Devosia sp.]
MTFGSIARRGQGAARGPALARMALAILGFAALSACTTVEGTNALVDASTFEREVMSETLRGIGMLEREQKPDVTSPRAPLVLPRNANALPAPQTQTAAAQLPEDSRNVQIDTSRISEDDLRRLRNARVITDPRSMSGRPLTEQETRMLTARMQAVQVRQTNRPLYIPPDSYFTTVKGQELVCMSKSGELVPLADPSCPPEIRAALAGQ